ncbi:hypothetical protein FHR20_000581 [Sphingomonas leidyi]|uniref:Uncharacterized protein n=2 Tax=Sphingomonas leidyi TaxID=68569 RepID=A0A7X5UWP1_9SPHN|nr:hypothetical protein [Sphingomonas leidyi]
MAARRKTDAGTSSPRDKGDIVFSAETGHEKALTKTILVFDCWLPGFTYVAELANEPGISLVFVHTSSMQTGEPAKEYRSFRKQYDAPSWVHDFSEFDYDFKRLFEQIRPDALLVTSLHHIEDRTALRFAKSRNVPTYFIPHGIFLLRDSPPPAEGIKKKGIPGKLATLFSKLPRVAYYTRFFWKFHFQMVRSGSRKNDFRRALQVYRTLIADYFSWQWHPNEAVQQYYRASIDTLILYDASIADYFEANFGAITSGATVVESGTLDVTRLLRQLHDTPHTRRTRQGKGQAYFISSPYPEYFSDRDSRRACAEILARLAALVREAGFDNLIYRPHPGEPAEFTAEISRASGAEIDTNRSFTRLVEANLVIGTSSSLLYSAVLLRKPIAIWTTRRIKIDLPYYEPLISYPKIAIDADEPRDEGALAQLSALEIGDAELDLSGLKDPIADLARMVRG